MVADSVGCTSAGALSARPRFHGHRAGGNRANAKRNLARVQAALLQAGDFEDLNLLKFANLNVAEQTRSEAYLASDEGPQPDCAVSTYQNNKVHSGDAQREVKIYRDDVY
jgi:hypothetical protein